jgi:LmbE family N-acetylglucosaminyl deacetylase
MQSEPPAIDLERGLVVSPHLDDAALSCGHLLAAATESLVVTVFDGVPSSYSDPPTPWDRVCGFEAGDDVVAQRREENELALAEFESTPRSLGLLDEQYRTDEITEREIGGRLRDVLEMWKPRTVIVPFGLQHTDHRLASAAALSLRSRGDARTWIGYAEFPYVWRYPGLLADRVSGLRRQGIQLTPVLGVPPAPAAKAAALGFYRSQLIGLEFTSNVERIARAPELLWLVADRPPFARRALQQVKRAAWKIRSERSWRSDSN